MTDKYASFISEVLHLNDQFKSAERYYERMMWHEENFEASLRGEPLRVRPVTIDFILNNECNYNCSGCTFNYVRRQQPHVVRRSMKTEHIPLLLGKLQDAGVKGIIFSGGGEPTLHKDLPYAMRTAREHGFDIALYSNGSFPNLLAKQIIATNPTYVRISLNAAPEEYREFHGIKYDGYNKVIGNIQSLSQEISSQGAKTTLGVSYLINNINGKNLDGILCSLEDIYLKDGTHLDYVAIKPEVNYRNPSKQLDPALIQLMTGFVNLHTEEVMRKFNTKIFYNTLFVDALQNDTATNAPCTSHGWVANVDWQGDMSFCVEFAMDERFKIGNLVEESFDEIWNSDRRRLMHDCINADITKCPQVCRNRVKNHLISILDIPYSQERIHELKDRTHHFKAQRTEPMHNNFL